MSDGFLKISEQCCDSDSYVDLGYICANTGFCFDVIRPVGAIYWFSLPFRLHGSLDVLFWLQCLLLATVCFTLGYVCKSIGGITSSSSKESKIGCLIAWLLSLLALIIGLWPTYFYTLSDTPASLFFIEAMLLLLLASVRNNGAMFFVAGLLMGIACIIRTAYFNPLRAALLIFVLAWIIQLAYQGFRKDIIKNQWKSLLILACFIPISAQYWSNWKNIKEFSFVSGTYSKAAFDLHLGSNGAAYDTVLPQRGYYWSPYCANETGIKSDWASGNLEGIACLLYNRAKFYLGSYASSTYLGMRDRNYMDNDEAAGWRSHNMVMKFNTVVSPAGKIQAALMQPAQLDLMKGNGETASYIYKDSIMPLPQGHYQLSVWLWSDAPTNVSIQLSSQEHGKTHQEHRENTEKLLTILPEPQKFTLDIVNSDAGYIRTKIGFFNSGAFDINKTGSFYIWGSKLEAVGTATGRSLKEREDSVSQIGLVGEENSFAPERIFSTVVLAGNLIAIILSMVFLVVLWRQKSGVAIIIPAGILVLYFGQCLFVVAEQRFVQGHLIVSWTFCIFLVYWLPLLRNKTVTHSDIG